GGGKVGRHVAEVAGIQRFTKTEQSARSARIALYLPQARKIRLTVHLWDPPGHVHLAVARARRTRGRLMQPLRTHRNTSGESSCGDPHQEAKPVAHMGPLLILYGTITLVRSTEVPSPTINVYAWFACWHMYSNSSVPSSQRRFDVPVKRAV